MPNPDNTHFKHIWFVIEKFEDIILNKLKVICLDTAKLFEELLSNTSNTIWH